MAPAPLTPEQESLVSYFESCGLSPVRSQEVIRSKYSFQAVELFKQCQLERREPKLEDKFGALCLQVAKDAGNDLDERSKGFVVEKIVKGDLGKSDQVTAAIKYLKGKTAPYDETEFDQSCGVGFTITPSELLTRVESYISSNFSTISQQSSPWSGIGKTLGQMKQQDDSLRWVAPLELKSTVEKVYEEKFGSKEESLKKEKEKKQKEAKQPKSTSSTTTNPSSSSPATVAAAAQSPDDMFSTGWLSRLHKPGENEQLYPERMKEHLQFTQGKVFTRFPPEPNGYLH
ncbi:hypothetical protein JCM5350_006616, partial [Sporobolomyces pararoseus]